MANPTCFKCGANCSEFLKWYHPIGDAAFILLFCNKCGAVQGVVKEK